MKAINKIGIAFTILLVFAIFTSFTMADNSPIDIMHTQVEIGKPVVWTTAIAAEEVPIDGIADLKLSESAQNIKVFEKDTNKEVEASVKKASGLEALITSLKTITGFAVSDGKNLATQEVQFVAGDKDYVIQYETAAPKVSESERVNGNVLTKRVQISSDIHYTDVLSYTDIPETKPENIRLYKIDGGALFNSKIDITDDPAYKVEFMDLNDNGFVDRIKWITPHLSTETFDVEVNIDILNVQSYPVVGGNWTVRFITTGTADLTISAINGTTYGEGEPDDLEWIELRCGDKVVNAEFDGINVYVQNYSCNDTSYHTVRVHTLGKHYQMFQFGDVIKFARNNAASVGMAFFHDSACSDVIDETDPAHIGENAWARFSWSGENQEAWAKVDDHIGTCTSGERSGCISNTSTAVSSPVCRPFNGDSVPSYLTEWSNSVTATFMNTSGSVSSEQATAILFVNHYPVLSTVSLTPTTVSPASDLTCTAVFSDPDSGQTFNASGMWTINGSNVAFTNSSCTQTGCNAKLFSGSFSDGDVINCTMTITDNFGESTSSITSNSVTVRDTSAPAVPTSVAASDVPSDQGGNISITWTRSTDDGAGENDVAGYYVLRSTVSSGGYSNITTLLPPGTETYFDNVGLENDGITYYYRIRVCDQSTIPNCDQSSYAAAIANSIPSIVGLNYTPQNPNSQENITFTAYGSDIDENNLSMHYTISVSAISPGGSDYTLEGQASCIYLGVNSTDSQGKIWPNATTECFATLDSSYITLADRVTAQFIANDGFENSTSRSTPGYIIINNSRPYATDVNITPGTPNQSSTLTCNYTYNDPDGTEQDLSMTKYKWYINNEGLNDFVEVPGAVQSTFSNTFDKDDLVKCAVMVRDTDPSSVNNPLYDDQYVESPEIKIIDNAIPQIISYKDSTSSENPVIKGNNITFNVSWVDYEDPSDSARIYVCDDFEESESQYSPGNDSVYFGSLADGTPKPIWIYSNQTGQYVHQIALRPFKYVKNNKITYAPDLAVAEGDFDVGLNLSDFVNESYYDVDLSETYTKDESIIREDLAHGDPLIYDSAYDTVLSGEEPPEGAILNNFSSGNIEKYRDITGNGFTYDDDIYQLINGSKSIVSVGDIRRTIVSQSTTDSLSTEFIYDIIVREVDNIGDTNGTVIARDNDNSFTIGSYNYFVPQYNAQPEAEKYLSFEFCIDDDNDDVCDSSGDLMNDSVYIEVSNSSVGYKIRDSDGNLNFSNPPVQIFYGMGGTSGCPGVTYCNTTNSAEHTVTCDYQTTESDEWSNIYWVKVCDEHNGCSDYRTGYFYTKDLPNITMVRLNTTDFTGNFTTNRNLLCEVNYTSQLPVTEYYSWYLNRGGSGFVKQNFPNVNSISNGNTMENDIWKCSLKLFDGYDYSSENYSSPVIITGNKPMTLQVTSVSHNSPITDPVPSHNDINFKVYWYSPDSTYAKAYICNSSNISSTGCWDKTFGQSDFSTANPIQISYTSEDSDNFSVKYWVKICQEDWNCSNIYPANGSIFAVNHRPNATNVTVEYVNSTSINCSYEFNDLEGNSEGNSTTFRWYKDEGSGFQIITGETHQILIVPSPSYESYKCAVRTSDEFDLFDWDYRNSSNTYQFGSLPGQPILYNPPDSVDSISGNWIIGYFNITQINVSAHARQSYNISNVVVQNINYNSTYYGSASLYANAKKDSSYIIISNTYQPLFVVNRKIEFEDHSLPYFSRYNITSTQDLMDGTIKVFISPHIKENLSLGTKIRIYNSTYPTGWFNLTLPDLFNNSNLIKIQGNSSDGPGPYLSFSMFVDLVNPEINISSIGDWTTGLNPTLTFRVTENHAINLSSLFINITNTTSVVNYSYSDIAFPNAIKNISCSGSATDYTCEFTPYLTNLSSNNISIYVRDTAGRKANKTKLNYFVNTSIQPLNSLRNGFYDGSYVEHIPAVIATNNIFTADWTSVPAGSIDHYEYKVDEYDETGLILQKTLVNWTNAYLNTSVNVTDSFRNRYIYKFVVRIKWVDGTYSTEKTSSGIMYYVSDAPQCIGSCVQFIDGSGNNISFTKDSHLQLTWEFQSEAEITQYRVVIGTAKYPYPGYNNILDQTITSSQIDYTGTFSDNDTIYANVRAMNENGIWSNWLSSSVPEITIDKSSPYGGNISYPSGIISTNITVHTFDGYDNISGIKSRILLRSTRSFVRGSCQGQNIYYNIYNTSSGYNSYTDNIQNGKCYRYKYKIIDRAGNSIEYPGAEGYDVMSDFTDPTEFTVTLDGGSFVTTSDVLNVEWTASDDPESGIAYYSYIVQEDDQSIGNWSNLTDVSNTTSKSVTIKLDNPKHQASYKVIVTAYSQTYGSTQLSTTSESNSVVYLDVTAPEPVDIIRVENETSPVNGWYTDMVDNENTTVELDGEYGIACIASRYKIDYEPYDPAKDYLVNCSAPESGQSNFSCVFNTTADGNYTYYVVCEDSTGNAQFATDSTEVNYIIEVNGPIISILNPTEGEVTGDTIAFEITINDTTPVSEPYYEIVNSSNYSQIFESGTITGQSGPNLSIQINWDSFQDFANKSANLTFIISANDSFNHTSTYLRNFTVDNTRPVINIYIPNEDNRFFKSDFRINITITNNPINTSYNITSENGSTIYSNFSTVAGTSFTWNDLIPVSTLQDGTYEIIVSASDVLGNIQTKNYTFYIDRTPPRYNSVMLLSEPIYDTDYARLKVVWPTSFNSIANTFDIERVYFEHDADGVLTNYSATQSGDNFSLFITADKLENGETVHWRSYAIDFSGNINMTDIQSFTVQNRPPAIKKKIDKVKFPTYSNGSLNLSEHIVDYDGDNLTYDIDFYRSGILLYDKLENNETILSNGGSYTNPLFVDGIEGKSILVEGSGSNVIKNASFESVSAGSGSDQGIWYETGSPTRDSSNKISGNYSARVNRNNYYYQIIAVNPDTDYSISAYMRSVDTFAYGRLHIEWLDGSKAYISNSLTCTPGPDCDFIPGLNTSWQRKSASLKSPSNAAFAKIYADAQNSSYVLMDDIQLEEKDYPTSFMLTERQGDAVQYNLSEIIDIFSGTVLFWVKPEWNGNLSQGRTLLDMSTATNQYSISYGLGGSSNISVSDFINYDVASWKAGEWHFIALTWGNYMTKLYVDGVEVGENSRLPLGAYSLYLGKKFNSENYSDAGFDNLVMFDKALNSTEISDLYSSFNLTDNINKEINYSFDATSNQYVFNTNGSWYGNFSAQINTSDNDSFSMSNVFSIQVTPENNQPELYLENQTINETWTLNYIINGTDADNDLLTYSINDSNLNVSASGVVTWTPSHFDLGTHYYNLSLCDNSTRPNNCTSSVFSITVTILDYDGDGLSDTSDYLQGDVNEINVTNMDNESMQNVSVEINGSTNTSQYFNGLYNITVLANGTPVVEFYFNFSQSNILNLSQVSLGKNSPESNLSYTYARGISGMPEGKTKTLFVDDLNPSIDTICIKDKEDVSYSDVSSDCNANDEVLLNCTASETIGQYSCEDLGSLYKVSGLNHSIVVEMDGCVDHDGDGYGTGALCLGYDCNDNDSSINPGETEIPWDSIDQDCDGFDLLDLDGDGYCNLGSTISNATIQCINETGTTGTDCNDDNSSINPGAFDIAFNGIDENCNGVDRIDNDGDGFCLEGQAITNATLQCINETGVAGTDCNDNNASIYPGGFELYYNGIDENCDGVDALDYDSDGYCREGYNISNATIQCAHESGGHGTDCNDLNSNINPGKSEISDNGIDDNCDGVSATSTSHSSGGSGGTGFIRKKQCDDKVDNDGDGLIDMNDPGCESIQDDNETNICVEKWICSGWGACDNGKQYKECQDLAECGTYKNRPMSVRDCQVSATPTCNDGIKNNDETDIDCGGHCAGCPDGSSCISDSDCQNKCSSSNLCYTEEVQSIPTCTDGIMNGQETGVDCGGPCRSCSVVESPSLIGKYVIPYRNTIIMTIAAIIIMILLAVGLHRKSHTQVAVHAPPKKEPLVKDEEYYKGIEKKEMFVLFEMIKGTSEKDIENTAKEHGIRNPWQIIELQKYYLAMTSKGYDRDDIMKNLEQKRWPEDLIDFIFKANDGLNMADKIMPGIKAWKDKGYTESEIRSALESKRFPYQVINLAFSLYKAKYPERDKRRAAILDKKKRLLLEIYKGYPQEKLKKILERKDRRAEILEDMLRLDDTVKEGLKSGLSHERLRGKLIAMGYEKELIDFEFSIINIQITILSRLRDKMPINQIKKELSKGGWPVELLDRILKSREEKLTYSQSITSGQLFVLNALHKGISNEKITEVLHQKGYPENLVPFMIKVDNHIKSLIRKGYSKKAIKEALKKHKWPEDTLDLLLQYY